MFFVVLNNTNGNKLAESGMVPSPRSQSLSGRRQLDIDLTHLRRIDV